ncbi:Sensor protein FixL [compost metagenome]
MRIIYVLMFLSLWTLGIIFLLSRTRGNVWLGLTILLGGSASFAFAMHLSIMPMIQDAEWLHPVLSMILYASTVIAMHIYFYVLPYVFFMGGLWLNQGLSSRLKMVLSLAVLPGPLVMLAIHLTAEPWNSFSLSWFRWWDGAYVLMGCVFYYLAYFREMNPERRRSLRRAMLIFPTVMVWAFTSDYVNFDSLKLGMWSFELDSNGMWQANFIAILGTVGLILTYSIRNGFLGIKLRIERERLDHSIKTLTMGVSILNHSIKNEIQKIDYLAEKCSTLIRSGQSVKAASTIDQVHNLTGHLLHMVNRIKEKAEDVVLDEDLHDVRSLVESVMDSARTLTENRPVELSARYEAEGTLKCDAVHIRETLSNLIRNALDAMPESGGEITLKTAMTRREFRIEVRDNGAGIPKEHLSKIFEPFFTTKKNALNYGLGLSYCSSVMSKHGGKMMAAVNEYGAGVTLTLHFPAFKFKPLAKDAKLAREVNSLDHLHPS